MPEYKILNNIIDYMESTGSDYKLVTVSIDQKLVDEINNKHETKFSLNELEKAADICLAHEWLKHMFISGSKYNSLGITLKGIGVARSKKKAEELKKSRSILKKTSDYIEEHKGLFIVLGFSLALATFALKLLGEK